MIEYSGNAVMVDAIEEGRIVKVPEDYAKREGLLILRRPSEAVLEPKVKEKKEEEARRNKGFIGMDDLRRPLKSRQSDLMRELVDNFHWVLLEKRKGKALTRKKLAEMVGESETNIKMIESGVLPMNNFILVNKLESFYGISLRKNKVPSSDGGQLRQPIDFRKRIMDRRMHGENKAAEGTEEAIDVSDSGKNRDTSAVESKEEGLDIVDLEKY